MNEHKHGGRRPGAGRKPEGRERLTGHVLPATAKAIREQAQQEDKTIGEVLDRLVATRGDAERTRG